MQMMYCTVWNGGTVATLPVVETVTGATTAVPLPVLPTVTVPPLPPVTVAVAALSLVSVPLAAYRNGVLVPSVAPAAR